MFRNSSYTEYQMGHRPELFLLSVAFLTLNFACAHSKTNNEIMEERLSKARPSRATYGIDGFYRDYSFPDSKNPRPSEFYFKKCSLSGRHPFPSSEDWECTEPQ